MAASMPCGGDAYEPCETAVRVKLGSQPAGCLWCAKWAGTGEGKCLGMLGDGADAIMGDVEDD